MRTPMRLGIALSASLMTACVLAISASSALAVQQLTASGGSVTGGLRDDLTTPPSNAQYGSDALFENTTAILRLSRSGTGINQSPRYDSYAGFKLHSNPTAADCSVAGGYIEFADFQNSTVSASGAASPTYADTLIAPWRVNINSASCTTNPSKVTISGVGLYFPTLADEVTGTITGTWEQPGANCAAGGVKLDNSQPGILINGTSVSGTQIDNGTSGGNAYLCVVSANNYVYPTTPTGPGALTGSITNN